MPTAFRSGFPKRNPKQDAPLKPARGKRSLFRAFESPLPPVPFRPRRPFEMRRCVFFSMQLFFDAESESSPRTSSAPASGLSLKERRFAAIRPHAARRAAESKPRSMKKASGAGLRTPFVVSRKDQETLILCTFACSDLGRMRVRTPSFVSAEIFSTSMTSESWNSR